MRVFGALPNLLVTARQKQRPGITYLRLDQAKIAGCIKQAGIPAFPVGQQLFDLLAKTHARNVTERYRRDNDVCPGYSVSMRALIKPTPSNTSP